MTTCNGKIAMSKLYTSAKLVLTPFPFASFWRDDTATHYTAG
jgi:hypothetical protein